jgi:hypothetical protein
VTLRKLRARVVCRRTGQIFRICPEAKDIPRVMANTTGMRARANVTALMAFAQFVGAAWLFGAEPAFAAPSPEIQMICPLDGSAFTMPAGPPDLVFGNQTLDLRYLSGYREPLPVCSSNGFVLYKSTFTENELERLRVLVKSDEYQSLRTSPPDFRAYWLQDRMGVDHWQVTLALVRANWATRAYASEIIARLPTDISNASGADIVERRLLLAEIQRQSRQFGDAAQTITEVDRGSIPYGETDIFCKYERSLIEARDSTVHTHSEVFAFIVKDPEFKRVSEVPVVRGQLGSGKAFLYPWEDRVIDAQWTDDGSEIFVLLKKSLQVISLESPETAKELACPDCGSGGFSKILIASDRRVVLISGFHLIEFEGANAALLTERKAIKFEGGYPGSTLSWDRQSLLYLTGLGLLRINLDDFESSLLPTPLGTLLNRSFSIEVSDPKGPHIVLEEGFGLTPNWVIWDYEKQQKVGSIPGGAFLAGETPYDFIYSHDGKSIYLVTHVGKQLDESCHIERWDFASQSKTATVRLPGRCPGNLVPSSDGRFVAFGVGNTASLWLSDLSNRIADLNLSGAGYFANFRFNDKADRLAVITSNTLWIYDILK